MNQSNQSADLEMTGPTSKHKIILKGVGVDQTDPETLSVTNVQFTHLFFISMLQLLEAEEVSEELKNDIKTAMPFLNTIVKDLKIEPAEDGHSLHKYSFTLYNLDSLKLTSIDENDPEGKEIPREIDEEGFAFIQSVILGYLKSPGVITAARMALAVINDIQSEPSSDETRKGRLYPGINNIDHNKEQMLSKVLADNLSKVIQGANRQSAIKQYEDSATNSRNRKPVYKPHGKEVEFVFDAERLAIKTAEGFADQLLKVRDAKVLQTFLALSKWTNLNDTFTFRDVPISDIMSLVLKSADENKFNTTKRRQFSEVLEYLASISLTIPVIGDRVNTKTGKKRAALKEIRNIKLFELDPEYSVKKEFQGMSKELLDPDRHFDKKVITRFSGVLMPKNGHLFKEKANLYFDSLLLLDTRHDAKAFLLGFIIQTRFNQLIDKEKCIEWERAWLIEQCDYQKTDKIKPSKATKQIANNLDKLKSVGIISGYSGLTDVNSDRVKIYPPQSVKINKVKPE